MPINNTDKWLMLDAKGNVIEGEDNPKAVSVLAAPGCHVDQDIVDKHKLASKLGGEPEQQVDVAGNPVVVLNGSAIAADALPDGHPDKPKASPEKAPVAPQDATAKHGGLTVEKEAEKPHKAPEKTAPAKPEAPKGK